MTEPFKLLKRFKTLETYYEQESSCFQKGAF